MVNSQERKEKVYAKLFVWPGESSSSVSRRLSNDVALRKFFIEKNILAFLSEVHHHHTAHLVHLVKRERRAGEILNWVSRSYISQVNIILLIRKKR